MNLRMSPVCSQPLKQQVTSTGMWACASPPGNLSAAFPLVVCGGALHSILLPSATAIANLWALLQVASLANTGAFEKFNTSKLVLWSLLKTEFDSAHKMVFGYRKQKREPERLWQSKAYPREEQRRGCRSHPNSSTPP